MMNSFAFKEETLLASKGRLLEFDEADQDWVEQHTAVKFQILRYGEDFTLRTSTDTPDSVLLVNAGVKDIISVKHLKLSNSLQVDFKVAKFCLQFNLATDTAQFFSVLQNLVDELKFRAQPLQQFSMMATPKAPTAAKGPDIEKMIEDLKRSVAVGDSQAASLAAVSLARHKVKLSISADEIGDMPGNRSKFNLDIVLEDRQSSGAKIRLPDVVPNMTIAYLKRMVFQMYDFPVEVQRWIIGQKIIKDTEVLLDLRVNSSTPVFIYLISAEKAGITRAEVELGKQAMIAQQQQQQEQQQYQQLQQMILQQTGTLTPPWVPPRQPVSRQSPSRGSKNDLPNVIPTPAPQAAAPLPPKKLSAMDVGWHCPACTLINPPTLPGCKVCMEARPEDYVLPPPGSYIMEEDEKKKKEELDRNEALMAEMERRDRLKEQHDRDVNYQMLLETDLASLIRNTETFECKICYMDVPQGDGVRLRECLHTFCRECLKENIKHNTEPVIMCPYRDGEYSCPEVLLDREIMALVSPQEFQQYLELGLSVAESQAQNAFHCKTPDCKSFCFYDDDINFFNCPVCHKQNCLTCKAIHEGMNCKEYQDDLQRRSANDQAAKMTKIMLEKMIKSGEAMHCPQCGIIMLKKEGCDWIKCSMCKTEVCWVTKGRRWGLAGTGDITGGCKCRLQGRKCHANCQNCH